MDNPAIPLTPDMILGLLEELSGMDNPLILQFCQLLESHPVARTSLAPSLGHSVSGTSATPVELSSQSLDSAPISETVSPISERQLVLDGPASELADIDQGHGGDSNNNCCRNGIKRTTFGPSARAVRDKTVIKRKDAGVEDGQGDSGQGAERSDDSDSSEESCEDGEVLGQKRKKKGRRKGRKAKKVKKDDCPVWLTDGSPPALYNGTDTLVIELCRIVSNDGLQSLADLTQLLINPDSLLLKDNSAITLGSLISACSVEDSKQMVADFQYMILLIRLAFHLER
jgi:hypothetical protein